VTGPPTGAVGLSESSSRSTTTSSPKPARAASITSRTAGKNGTGAGNGGRAPSTVPSRRQRTKSPSGGRRQPTCAEPRGSSPGTVVDMTHLVRRIHHTLPSGRRCRTAVKPAGRAPEGRAADGPPQRSPRRAAPARHAGRPRPVRPAPPALLLHAAGHERGRHREPGGGGRLPAQPGRPGQPARQRPEDGVDRAASEAAAARDTDAARARYWEGGERGASVRAGRTAHDERHSEHTTWCARRTGR